MSVDTYIGSRDTGNYQKFEQDGIELLVSNALAPHIREIALDCKKFLFFNRLKADMELSNGRWIRV